MIFGFNTAVRLDDIVYHIQSDVSFSFNPAFDQKTHYRTRSILGSSIEAW